MARTGRLLLDTFDASRGFGTLGGIAFLGALLLSACAVTVDVPDRLPASTEMPADYGEVTGSILLLLPTGAADPDEEKSLALWTAAYEILGRRHVIHDYGIGGRTSYPGDSYRITFEPGVERHFVIRAPAGRYVFEEIRRLAPGAAGKYNLLAGLSFVDFNIHPGTTTYIGRLTLTGRFYPSSELDLPGLAGELIQKMDVPKIVVDIAFTVADCKETSLRALGQNDSNAPSYARTELMEFHEGRANSGMP